MIAHPGDPNTCSVFSYIAETHQFADTGERRDVHIYSSVVKLIENNDALRQQLGTHTYQLLQARDGGDVMVALRTWRRRAATTVAVSLPGTFTSMQKRE